MPPLARSATLPTLLSLTRLLHAIPKRSEEWVIAASKPIEPEDPPDSPAFWWKLGLSVVFVLSGGVFAGLTLALMGSDDLNLRVLATSSSEPRERKAASKVLKLLARGRHWVLVVLLLGNVIVNESLPIFLDDVLGGGLYAVIVSTTMIVIFGEIIPQAVCVRYGLAIGGACAPMVWCFMILFSPIAWPTAKLLDYILGKDEGHTYKKAELKSFLQFHREGEEPLRDDEIGILNGVLSLNDKHAKEIMTPIKDCLTLPSDKVLDHESIDHILLSGFSRIPVHEPGQKDNFIGMLLVKRLITYNPDDEWPVSKFSLLPLPEAKPEINCFQALDYFQTGRAHLLLISETPGQKGGAIGIVSLEDLIEEIIGEEIVDETDRYEDNHSKKMAKRSGPAAVMRGIIERRRVINAFSRRPSRTNTSQAESPNPNGSQAHNTISLPGQTNGTTKATNTQDGILIQIDNGNLVAEPVGFTGDTENSVSIDPSKRLTIGDGSTSIESDNEPISKQPENLMDTIEETSPVTPSEEQVKSPVSTTVEETKADVTIEVNDNEMLSPNPDQSEEGSADGSGGGSGGGSGNVSEHEQENGEQTNSANGSGSKKKKKKGKKGKKGGNAKENILDDSIKLSMSDVVIPFENNQEFTKACLIYLERYKSNKGKREEGNPLLKGKNKGWEWIENKNLNQGYLYRKLIKYLKYESNLKNETESNNQEEEEEEVEEEMLEENIFDEAFVNIIHPVTIKSKCNDNDNENENEIEIQSKLRLIELEEYIIYSKIFKCSQFCFNAYDENGSPISVNDLLSLNFFKSISQTIPTLEKSLYDDNNPFNNDSSSSSSSSFSLIQSLKHPITKQLVFGINPFKVNKLVKEILLLDMNMIQNGNQEQKQNQNQESKLEKKVKWLECWLMVISNIVDLDYP
ncbi:uncharacterized protein I206_105550 [Kwoniella pini CBS 10737]|uniref:Hemolysin n=1 Tax=Kwoniella pini CBS 10737 TaxID=1296096 RepID=A0A1B9I3X7_9TREE|nr:hemolysin [Kwoniella pini CBS 10737]OCF50228.1 hemolysin [Kwoniella pini CBS 10737]